MTVVVCVRFSELVGVMLADEAEAKSARRNIWRHGDIGSDDEEDRRPRAWGKK